MAEGERRAVVDEKRYAIITKESIVMMAESGDHDDIDDTVAGILGEDISYRLREITQVIIYYTKERLSALFPVLIYNTCTLVISLQKLDITFAKAERQN